MRAARCSARRTPACCASSRRSSTPVRSATARRSSRREVDPDRVDEAAAVISEHPGVSHNYKRNHAYNLWYTLAVPPGDDFDAHLDVLHRESGALVTRKLPTLQLYKIGVKLDMTGEHRGRTPRPRCSSTRRPSAGPTWRRPSSTDARGRDDRSSCRRTCRSSSEPFAVQGERIGVSEDRRARGARTVQGAQADAPLRGGDEPPQRRASRRTRWACGRCPKTSSTRSARRWRASPRCQPLLPPPDLRRLALHGVHDGARPHARATARRRSRRSATRPASTSTRCSGRSRSTRRCGCATSRPTGTSGARTHLTAATRLSTAAARVSAAVRRVSHQRRRAGTGEHRAHRRDPRQRPAPHVGIAGERGSPPRSCASAASPRACSRSLATTHGCIEVRQHLGRRVAEAARPHRRRARSRPSPRARRAGAGAARSRPPRRSRASRRRRR